MKTFKPFTLAEIEKAYSDKIITKNARNWARVEFDYLNKNMRIFGSSTKVEKGAEKRETYIIYLAPADKVSFKTLCIGARASGCEKPCLVESGQLGMKTGQDATVKRTMLYLLRLDWFNAQVLREIDSAEKKAKKPGNAPASFRINGTSDIDISHIVQARPNSEFYDYSKILSRISKNKSPNYSITFSGSMYSEQSISALKKAFSRGNNVALAFNTKNLASDKIQVPEKLAGVKLENFDKSDLRMLDAQKSIGTLSRKGSNKRERALDNQNANSFFVNAANIDRLADIIAIAS